MSDAAVKAKTGKDWTRWFAILDAAGAAAFDHRAIVDVVSKKHDAPGWWRQMIAVEYERARGLRARHETTSGYSVSVSKTIAAGVSKVYAATAQVQKRKRWFPAGALAVSSQTEDKYFRGSWRAAARIEFGFYAKGRGKAQIAVQINKLAKASDVERERAAWKAAFIKLASILEESAGPAQAAGRPERGS
jgi:hypothetical protein